MLALAVTIAAALLLLGLLIALERSRSREAASQAEAVLTRSNRRAAGHRAALADVSRAAARVYASDQTTSDPLPPTPPPT